MIDVKQQVKNSKTVAVLYNTKIARVITKANKHTE